ncbi:MAG: hypothetical protein K2X81_28100, partial [Candidatus Obscuribacterales bacterium]|nr:hypothetical protein [Candidatus Obscuribacterales bacterium]
DEWSRLTSKGEEESRNGQYDQAKANVVREKGPLTHDNPNYYDQKSEEFAKTLAEFMKNPEQGIKTLTEQAKNVAAFCGAIETKIAATLKAQQAHEVLSGQRTA